jgi:hypothetical protein
VKLRLVELINLPILNEPNEATTEGYQSPRVEGPGLVDHRVISVCMLLYSLLALRGTALTYLE